jgi:hypothetical protein
MNTFSTTRSIHAYSWLGIERLYTGVQCGLPRDHLGRERSADRVGSEDARIDVELVNIL